jgi:hypothetical protein
MKGAEAGPSRREQRPLVAPRWAYPEQHLRLSSVKQPALREYKRIWVESRTAKSRPSPIHDFIVASLAVHSLTLDLGPFDPIPNAGRFVGHSLSRASSRARAARQRVRFSPARVPVEHVTYPACLRSADVR